MSGRCRTDGNHASTENRRFGGVLATLGCVVLSGCQQAPTAPARAQAQTTPIGTQAQTTHIGGQVTDALLRGLSEALVEVLDGPDAGKRFVADADGGPQPPGRLAPTALSPSEPAKTGTSRQRWQPPGHRLTPRQHMCSCECQALNPTTPLGRASTQSQSQSISRTREPVPRGAVSWVSRRTLIPHL